MSRGDPIEANKEKIQIFEKKKRKLKLPRFPGLTSGSRSHSASEHSEVSGKALDLKKNLGLHFFNLDTQEK